MIAGVHTGELGRIWACPLGYLILWDLALSLYMSYYTVLYAEGN